MTSSSSPCYAHTQCHVTYANDFVMSNSLSQYIRLSNNVNIIIIRKKVCVCMSLSPRTRHHRCRHLTWLLYGNLMLESFILWTRIVIVFCEWVFLWCAKLLFNLFILLSLEFLKISLSPYIVSKKISKSNMGVVEKFSSRYAANYQR